MSNLAIRIITGVIAGAATVAAIWVSPIGLWAFCALVSTLGLIEFLKISGVKSKSTTGIALLTSAIAWVLALNYVTAVPETPAWVYSLLICFIFFLSLPVASILLLFDPKEKQPLHTTGQLAMGLLYVLLPFGLLLVMAGFFSGVRGNNDTEHMFSKMALGIFFLIWATDIFAYFGGRFLGKHKLFERISPKKTWEGSIIGAAACIGTGFLLQHFWAMPGGWDWRIAAAIVAPTCQLGDLVESMFKRSLDLKDSGGILPGHGGILDRFDGFLVSMPFLASYGVLLSAAN